MAFAITANFLLGTYQGSDSGGRPEPYPSPDRLYKACVAAAYNTFDFERQTDDRVLTDEQIKNALAWLEDNPPHSILLPRVIPPTSDAISYRDKGYLEKGKVKKSPDKASKAMSYCQNAVESLLLTWQWDENPNQEVINTLNLLCGEVPYLGEACSVVELKVIVGGGIPEAQRDKTWTLEKGPMLSGISRHNRVFAVPGTGRLEELKRAYMAANPEGKGKGKNAAKSKIRAKEAEQNFLNGCLVLLPLRRLDRCRIPRKSVIGELSNQCIWHWAMYGVISMFPMIFRVRGNRDIGRRWMQLLISLLISEYSIADG
mgnify:CR=1 FL=1